MRITMFRQLMVHEFGQARAEMLSRDHVFAGLGGRTVDDALNSGVDPKKVWRVVCDDFEVPAERR